MTTLRVEGTGMIEIRGREHDGQPSGMAMKDEAGRTVVRVWGEVDLEVRRTSSELCRAVAERALPVVVEARDVTFIDSAGMSILVRLARDAQAGDYPVEVHNAPWMMRELLTITGVDTILTLVDDEGTTTAPAS